MELADVEITLCRMASIRPTKKNSDVMSHILPVRGNETVGLIVLHHGWTTTSLIFWIVSFPFRWQARVNTVRIKYKLVKPMYILTKMKLQHALPCGQLLFDLSRKFLKWGNLSLYLDSSWRKIWNVSNEIYSAYSYDICLDRSNSSTECQASLLHRDEQN